MPADEELAQQLVERARSEGVELVGPGGLLTDLTKTVLETALEVEMEDHLGYAKHAPEGRDRGNSRNGSRSKTVLTEVGEVEIAVPRDWDGSLSRRSSRSAEQAARERFSELAEKWGERYPAIVRLWENAWAESCRSLAYNPEIRQVIYSTNAIESLHARFRNSVRARGHFPH